ncbi:FAD-dependent oxidoreductase, partial [Anaerolineae bacterium CFX9]|nr:FAD-dependent oxidoreductase [Anaerolineae bacterium CFX9]
MPSALETLVKVLKLERDHGYSNKAMVGGLSAFSGGWAAQAHAQARRPEHHALVDELSDRLRDYDQAPREDRHALVNYLLERIVGRAPMPAEYQSRLEEYARRMAEGFYPAPRFPENEREPAVQRGQPGGRPEQGERRENERRERPDRRERRSREAPPTAKQADSASSPSGQTPGSGAGNQQNRPPKGDRGQQERKGGQKQNQPQAQKSRKDQGRSQPRREDGTSSERENIGGGRPDEFNGMEYEFRGGSGVLDLPARPQLTRVPRAPRRAMSKEEAADILQGLNADVETINGVGEKMAELLHRVGIRTINDFLFYLPRRYDDYTQLRYIARLTENELVTVIGTVRTTQVRIAQRGRRDFVLTLDDGTAQMEVIFYGQFFLNRVFREGQQVVLRGRVSRYRSQFQLVNPEYEIVDPEDLRLASIVPVYPLTEGLSGRWMRRTMSRAIEYWAERLPDYIPEGTLERTELADLGWALKNIHFPESFEHLHHAKRRFIFDQLLLLQLAILGNRRIWQSEPGIPLQTDDAALESFIASAFPYPLTGAQRRAIHDIRRDIERPVPMNRLLQGDVGAGKTAVAAAAMVMAFMNGKQSALMAPTGILAEQHYRNLSAMMERFPAEIGQDIGLNQIGYLFVLDNEQDFEQFKRNVALQNSLGIESRVLSVEEIRQRVPLLNLEGVVGGTIYECDGLADPNSIVQGYINKLRQMRQANYQQPITLLNDITVTNVRMANNKVQAVVMPVGEIATETIVIAAGAWSGQFGAIVGVDIPIVPVRRQIAVTTPIPQLPPDFPFVLFFGQSLYFHPESGQSILTGKSNSREPVGFNQEVDPRWTETHLMEAMHRFPLLEQAGLLSEWAGLYEVTPDEQAILGKLPGVEGV